MLLNKGEALWTWGVRTKSTKGRSLQQIGLFLALLLGVGVEGPAGNLTIPGNPFRTWNNSILSPPDSESPALCREMGNAPVDIRDILAATPSLSLWQSTQRHSGRSIVGEGMPRYPDTTPLTATTESLGKSGLGYRDQKGHFSTEGRQGS